MSTFVFVHGAWHGSWCWAPLVSRLRAGGHVAVAVDLPGRAGDSTPHSEITLDSYVSAVRRVVEGASEPVILVGHSLGGATITATSEACPQRIRTLVYLAAFLLADGQSVSAVMEGAVDSLIAPNVEVDAGAGSVVLRADAPCAEIFYGTCTPEDARRASAMLVPEPLVPSATPVHTKAERFGRVPRVYVECLRDRALPLAVQRRLQAALPCVRTITLDTDHSPFFSAPDELAAALGAL